MPYFYVLLLGLLLFIGWICLILYRGLRTDTIHYDIEHLWPEFDPKSFEHPGVKRAPPS